MRRITVFGFMLWTTAWSVAQAQVATTQPARPAVVDGEITVYFSPQGGATQAIVNEIAQARKTIQVQAYSFRPPGMHRLREQGPQVGSQPRRQDVGSDTLGS